MKNLGIFLGVATCSASLMFTACGDVPGERIVFPNPDEGRGGAAIPGAGVGQSCIDDDCRQGLECSAADVCEPGGSLPENSQCTIGPECDDGHCLYVPDINRSVCQGATGDGAVGDKCSIDLDCEVGLKCGLNGLELACIPSGSGDVGDVCALQSDCFQGLVCLYDESSPVGSCGRPVPPLGIPLWQGVTCPEQDDSNVQALFQLPGADGTPGNSTFFDHPYPSDFRLGADGRPDLDGFPTPGRGLLGVDMVAAYVDAVESGTRGWSTNPVVYFRFSGAIELSSLQTPEGEQPRVFFTDVDALPDDNEIAPPRFSTQYSIGSGSTYICNDYFALKTPRDTLVPGHRHIAWITTDARSREDNSPVSRSPQFEAMLAESPPQGDDVLAKAYEDFAPLREFLEFYEGSSNEVDPDSILIATVFTTDDPLEPMRALEEAISDDEPTPTASQWVHCDGQNDSPCPQADASESRACGSGTTDYDEYHALIELPIFQEGTPPYLLEGGNISASRTRTEEVCMSMTVPKGAEPAEGWPLVIYGHGTGGSFRGNVRDSVAGELARATPSFATLGYDAVQHGPRRGEGEDAENEPENLFFNFVNPDAARGNPLQGAADVLSVIKFAQSGSLATARDTGASAISVDPLQIYYFGHSQGSTHGSMGIPFSDVDGTVLSGNGGGLAEALINKTQPVDIASALPFLIQDAYEVTGEPGVYALRMGSKHPVLSLLQHYIDTSDPINFGPLFTVRPEESRGPKNIFQTFGLDDSYAPPLTLASFIYAAELDLAEHPNGVDPSGDNLLRRTPATDPVSDNFTLETDTVTAVCRQYEPASGSDGHFVVHDVPEANSDAIGFFESLASGVSPTVPASAQE